MGVMIRFAVNVLHNEKEKKKDDEIMLAAVYLDQDLTFTCFEFYKPEDLMNMWAGC